MTANSACRSGASGVVSALPTGSPPMQVPDRADQAGPRPAARSAARDQVRGGRLALRAGDADQAQRARPGCRRSCAATSPRTARGSSTTSTGQRRPRGAARRRSVGQHRDRARVAPRRRRSGRRACAHPGSAAYRSPGAPPRVGGDAGDDDAVAGRRLAARSAERAASDRPATPVRHGPRAGAGSLADRELLRHVAEAIGASPVHRERGLRAPGRRHTVLLQGGGHQVVEHRAAGRRRHRALARLLHDDVDDEARGRRRARSRRTRRRVPLVAAAVGSTRCAVPVLPATR